MIKGWKTIKETKVTILPEHIVVEAVDAEETEIIDPNNFLPISVYFLNLAIHEHPRLKRDKLKVLLKWNSVQKQFAVEIFDTTDFDSMKTSTLLDTEWINERTGFTVLKDKKKFIKWIIERANKHHRFYEPIPW